MCHLDLREWVSLVIGWMKQGNAIISVKKKKQKKPVNDGRKAAGGGGDTSP